MKWSAYDTLGVAGNADDATIRQRYLTLIQAHPPDRDEARFLSIREAYEKIATAEQRLAYQVLEQPVSGLEAWLEEALSTSGAVREIDPTEMLPILAEALYVR